MTRPKEAAGTSTSPAAVGNEEDESHTLQPVTQDPVERRLIRHQYRQLLQGTMENQDVLVRPESNQLHETLTEANNLFQNVKMTREAALDSQLIAVLSNLSRKKAQSLQADLRGFEPIEFTEKLISFLRRQQMATSFGDTLTIPKEGWNKLGDAAQSFFKRTPPLHLMFGSFERGPMQPKVGKSRRTKVCEKENGKTTAPKQLKSFRETEQTEVTTEQVEHVLDALRAQHRLHKKQPMCYFQFIVNPHSFGKTIENMFYTSFLIKDGYAKISLDKDKFPVIVPIFETEQERGRNTESRHQVVMSLTKDDWKEIVSTFKITKCVITPRELKTNGRGHSTQDDELVRSDSDSDG